VHAEISIESTGPRIRELIERLPAGETVSILGPDGSRVAILLTVRRPKGEAQSFSDWLARLDSLAQRVSKAWNSDKSALETLAEMRR